jgi:hypothetical protein
MHTHLTPAQREQAMQQRGEIPTVFYRDMVIAVDAERMATRAEGETRIPVAISSEKPVLRYDWWTDEKYYEVLDHAPGSIDLSYARDGLPFLFEHSRWDQRGILEEITVGDDRKLRGMLRLSRTQAGQDLGLDVTDGIRKKVSVGYSKGDQYEQTAAEQEGGIPTRRYTRWTPMEASTVSIPADYDVGVGRSAGGAAPATTPPAPNAAQRAEDTAMHTATGGPATGATGTATGGAPPAGSGSTGTGSGRDLRADMLAIIRMCRANGVGENDERGYLERGLNPDEVARAILEARGATIKPIPTGYQPILDLPRTDQKEFVIGRALVALVTGNWKEAGYERAISDALSEKLGRGTQGFFVPTHELMGRTALSAGGSTTGQKSVFTEPGGFIELLRNTSVIMRQNPLVLSGLQGNIALVRQSASGSAAWYAELPGADYTESNLQLDLVTMSPKIVADTQAYSKLLAIQSYLVVDQLVRSDLGQNVALKYDRGCLHDTGAANSITGLYSLAGVNAVAMGGAITYAKVVDMETAVEAANAALGGMAYITTPEIKGKAKLTQLFAGTNGAPLWTGPAENGEMNGYRAMASNQVLKNLGGGTNEHGIVFGAFTQAIVADWGAVDVTVDMTTRARQSLINVTAVWFADFNTRHPEAFAKGTGLTNT